MQSGWYLPLVHGEHCVDMRYDRGLIGVALDGMNWPGPHATPSVDPIVGDPAELPGQKHLPVDVEYVPPDTTSTRHANNTNTDQAQAQHVQTPHYAPGQQPTRLSLSLSLTVKKTSFYLI